MVTSRPCFSKKPRSTAMGSASMSMAATMPTFSLTGSLDCAAASDGSKAKANNVVSKRRMVLPFRWERLDALDPEVGGQGRGVAAFHSPNFDCIFLCSGHASVGLEKLYVKALRWKRERHEYVDAFVAGWKAG